MTTTQDRTRGPRKARRTARKARRTIAALLALALAVLWAFAVPGLAGAARGAGATASVKPTVVLVHGAFTDASSWTGVIERLQRAGYTVLAPADPLRSVTGDGTYIASVLASIKGPIVVVGHSYAGMVITNAAAGNPHVKALVYVSAYIPAVGESAVKLTGQFPGSELTSALQQVPFEDGGTKGVDLYLKPASYRQVFLGSTVSPARAAVLAAEQRPLTYAAATQPSQKAAWKTIPSWDLISMQDQIIPPAAQVFMAHRAHAHVVEVNSSHASPIVHPAAVAALIMQAAAKVG
jgi:pimeloyl-ACP methyl ester carboxylesterase